MRVLSGCVRKTGCACRLAGQIHMKSLSAECVPKVPGIVLQWLLQLLQL